MDRRWISILWIGGVISFSVSVYFILPRILKSVNPTFVSQKAFGKTDIKGINIGNALDAPSPGEWGVDVKPEYFAVIREAGFNTIRLPVRFSAHLSTQPQYSIEPDFLESVKTAVDEGLNSGLIIILDLHHFDAIMSDPAGNQEKLIDIWEQVSRAFKDYPDTLYFEILNEPSGSLTYEEWNVLSGRVINTIRQYDPGRMIIVDSGEFSHIGTLAKLSLPKDPRLTATFHFYEPFNFSHQGAFWVDGSKMWMGTTWVGTTAEKKQITDRLDEAARWSSSMKIPVMMGEFGTIELADRDSRLRWTSFVAREAEKRNIGWVYWQFCSNFAIYSCESGRWDTGLLGALIPVKTSN
jgi:endoglucanase